MSETSIIEMFFPEGLLEFFVITDIKKEDSSFRIFLEEKNIIPDQYQGNKLISNGFHKPISIQDFPLRGKACYLQVKRRRWLNEDTGLSVSRDWNLIAQGTRKTRDFALFLKGINRYAPGQL